MELHGHNLSRASPYHLPDDQAIPGDVTIVDDLRVQVSREIFRRFFVSYAVHRCDRDRHNLHGPSLDGSFGVAGLR